MRGPLSLSVFVGLCASNGSKVILRVGRRKNDVLGYNIALELSSEDKQEISCIFSRIWAKSSDLRDGV